MARRAEEADHLKLGPSVRAVLGHPSLWATGTRQLFVLAPRGWWRRPPFLPMPAPDYLRFRMETAYGDPERDPEPDDLITYLRWCRNFPGANDH